MLHSKSASWPTGIPEGIERYLGVMATAIA